MTDLGRLYLAAPIQLYRHPDYQEAYDRLCAAGWDVGDVRGMYADDRDWKRLWPEAAPTYDALAFILWRGWIGRGVAVEMRDMEALGRPVWFAGCDLHERCTDYQVGPPTGNWAKWRRVWCT